MQKSLAPEKIAQNSKNIFWVEMLRGGLLVEILCLVLTSEPNTLNSIPSSITNLSKFNYKNVIFSFFFFDLMNL